MAAYKRIKSPRNPSKGVYTVPYRGGSAPRTPQAQGRDLMGQLQTPLRSSPSLHATGLRFAPSEARSISWSEFGTTPTNSTLRQIHLVSQGRDLMGRLQTPLRSGPSLRRRASASLRQKPGLYLGVNLEQLQQDPPLIYALVSLCLVREF